MSPEEAVEMVRNVASQLGEYFDAVQILVSWVEDGQTKAVKQGVGDWYARQGLAHEFINSDIAQETAFQIANKLKDAS